MAAAPSRATAAPRYRDAYCAQVTAFMGQGYSLTAFAGEIGASRTELQRWCEAHPKCAEAVARGQARRARVLEDRLLTARGSGALGAHLTALKSSAPDEWAGASPRSRPTASAPPQPAVADLPDNGRG